MFKNIVAHIGLAFLIHEVNFKTSDQRQFLLVPSYLKRCNYIDLKKKSQKGRVFDKL